MSDRATAQTITAFVRACRTKLGLSQVQFAQLLGVAQSTVSKWEDDTTPDYLPMVAMSLKAGIPLPLAGDLEVGFGAPAVRAVRERLADAERTLPKVLLASMKVPDGNLQDLAGFLVMLDDLVSRYRDGTR